MGKTSKVLGIVLARGGSKGIPHKNIVPLNGLPLIGWTLRTAVKSGIFDRLIVSTDDEAIAKSARDYGAEVPFLRPKALASDRSPSIDSVIHALEFLKSKDAYAPEFIFLLQPTSPFRSVEDIRKAMSLMKSSRGNKFDALVSMVAVEDRNAKGRPHVDAPGMAQIGEDALVPPDPHKRCTEPALARNRL